MYTLQRKHVLWALGLSVLVGAITTITVLYLRSERTVDVYKDIIEEMEAKRIRDSLRYLSSEPHMAGTERDEELAQWIKDKWIESGLDNVEVETYDLLLSFPNVKRPNKVRLLDGNGSVVFESRHIEDLDESELHPEFVHAFNSYAKAGKVEGQVVYVNYGTVEDFEMLEDMGESVKDKLCIIRYGKIFRGNKVENCATFGGIGAILYSDPSEVAPGGTAPSQVYPNTQFLAPSGIQRGNVRLTNWDPLSPGWPSVAGAYRMKVEEVQDDLPRIPVQPIGYGDAYHILSKLGGVTVPLGWQGKVPGVDYKIGGSFSSPHQQFTLELNVHNELKTVNSSNVIGYIRGSVEPDRFVLFGNHRDAWGYGSLDPSSGTAALMEAARVLGNRVRNTSWRPRRTIVFASWTAEEQGLIGATEWMEHKLKKVSHGAVAHINMDTCMVGPIPFTMASPTISHVAKKALMAVKNPFEDGYLVKGKGKVRGENYYEFWQQWLKMTKGANAEPRIGHLGASSDHAPSAFIAGIPSALVVFNLDHFRYPNVKDRYPSYHTGMETFQLVDKLVDPGLKVNLACGQTASHMVLQLADSRVLPYNFTNLASTVLKSLDKLESKETECFNILVKHNGSLSLVKSATRDFLVAVTTFESSLSEKSTSDMQEIDLRILNDQLQLLEKNFLLEQGLSGRKEYKHALLAPAKHNSYGSSAFPGIVDLCYGVERLGGSELIQRMEELKRHLSDLMIMLRNAVDGLRPVHFI